MPAKTTHTKFRALHNQVATKLTTPVVVVCPIWEEVTAALCAFRLQHAGELDRLEPGIKDVLDHLIWRGSSKEELDATVAAMQSALKAISQMVEKTDQPVRLEPEGPEKQTTAAHQVATQLEEARKKALVTVQVKSAPQLGRTTKGGDMIFADADVARLAASIGMRPQRRFRKAGERFMATGKRSNNGSGNHFSGREIGQ
jgi:hypothetical protein